MGARDVLDELACAGLQVTAEGDRLVIRPASKLTDSMRAAVREAKPEMLALLRQPVQESGGFPSVAWTDTDIASFLDRRARLMRWGWPEPDAERLAERLVIRDREKGDDRVSCTDCRHYRPGRCGNHGTAGLNVPDMSRDLAALLQRCPGFGPTRGGDMTTRKKAGPIAAPVDKTQTLRLPCVSGTTQERAIADLVRDGLASNASTSIRFARAELGEVSLTDMVASLQTQGEAVNRGDLASAERMLAAQAATLNTVFAELARRASLNMGEHLGAAETYMRLALKAQSQSRATVETLAAIKNPPVVFARQANINNGGQQQVNNGAPAPHGQAGNHHLPNELLEESCRPMTEPTLTPLPEKSAMKRRPLKRK